MILFKTDQRSGLSIAEESDYALLPGSTLSAQSSLLGAPAPPSLGGPQSSLGPQPASGPPPSSLGGITERAASEEDAGKLMTVIEE